ncbi:MAG: hypothetical protein Q8J62_05655, partial [Candidatus Cloacimonadaceae bacterium]|nr:hypothetical protein [Candidatus Cloacimonadaceae bacterium]
LKEIIGQLKTISDGNENIKNEMQKVFENINQIPEYTKSVQTYLGNLNNKLDTFREVGDKVHEVKTEFENFSRNLSTLLSNFVQNAQKFQELMEKSFGDYDKSLKTLFDDFTSGRKEVNLVFYDPGTLNELKNIADRNQKLLEAISIYSTNLNEIAIKLLEYSKTHQSWFKKVFSRNTGR